MASGKNQYQGASRSYDELKIIRVPAIGSLKFRGTSASKDQQYMNGYFDVLTDPETQKKEYFFVKRPGLTQTGGSQPAATTGNGRGVYAWNGKSYSVVGNKIYSGTTDLGVTLSGSTGRCGFAETRPGLVTQYLGINDGVKLYLISTGDVVTTITVNFPTPNTGHLVYMDGYFFVMKTDNSIWSCTVDTPGTWDVSKFIYSQQYNGAGVGIAHQNNILIAFTDRATTMFYDNANSAGSPLSLYEQAVQQYGCASKETIVVMEDSTMWVSNTYSGGYSVMRMEGIGAFKDISTAPVERLLKAEGSSIASGLAVGLRAGGKRFYILHLVVQGRTLVYDIEEDLWVEWEAATGSAIWPIVSTYQYAGLTFCQHQTNGWVYVLSDTIYQDDAVSYTVRWRTSRLDFDTNMRKFVREVDLICDTITATATAASLQYYDDDYITVSTARTMDMALPRCYAMNLGNFRRRAWLITYSGTGPCRWQALEFRIRLGQQ